MIHEDNPILKEVSDSYKYNVRDRDTGLVHKITLDATTVDEAQKKVNSTFVKVLDGIPQDKDR